MAAGQHRAPVGQQRDLTGVFQQTAGILQAEQGRELVFPRHRGQMAGHAARFADQARSPGKQRGPAGLGPLDDQDAAPRERKHVRILAGHENGPHGDPGTDGHPPLGQDGQISRKIVPCHCRRGSAAWSDTLSNSGRLCRTTMRVLPS